MKETDVNTKSDNELIAEFMGFTYYGNGIWWTVPKGEDLKYKAFKLHKDKLLYSTCWDWLMPVVEKIQNMDDEFTCFFGFGIIVNIGTRSRYTYCRIENWRGREVAGNSGQPVLIESVYKTVVEFIKWYNTLNHGK